MIILIAVFVVILGVMGGGFFLMWSKINAASSPPMAAEEEQAAEQAVIDKMGPLHPLDTFIVNLADEGGNRYLRVTMTLEVKDPSVIDSIQKGLPQIRNAVLMILPSKKYDDIYTLEGKDALRSELIAHFNSLLPPESITNIFFTEFVVQ
jgi:flagellar FliL protein